MDLSPVTLGALATAVIWFALFGYQVVRDRFRTWTEVFFLAACLFVAGYAVSDVLFFTAVDPQTAHAAAVASLTCMTFAALFFMMYGTVLRTRMRPELFFAIAPAIVFLALIPSQVLPDVRPPSQPIGINWLPVYSSVWFVAWVALVFIYGFAAFVSVYLTYKEVKRHAVRLARRLVGILVGFVASIAFAGATNAALGVTGAEFPPLFSTTLVLPGLLLFLAVSPLPERSVREILRQRKAREYAIGGAFVLYEDGTLIGSELALGQDMVDEDLFGATLDVIQNFMRTSFPVLRGKWLQSIRHGDYTLALERGRWASAVIVMRGQENDQLRRHMREVLLEFEAANRQALSHWRGDRGDVKGLNVLLAGLLGEV